MRRDQRGGAAGLDDQAGPGESEEVGDPGGDHVERVARCGVLGDPGGALAADVLVVVPAGADEHAGPAARERAGRCPGVLQRPPGGLQHHPLLRVEHLRLAGGDAEEGGVEPVDVGEESADGLDLALRVELRGGVPTARGDGADGVVPLHHQPPEALDVRGVGEPSRHADDGQGLGRVLDHRVCVHVLFLRASVEPVRARAGARPGACGGTLGRGVGGARAEGGVGADGDRAGGCRAGGVGSGRDGRERPGAARGCRGGGGVGGQRVSGAARGGRAPRGSRSPVRIVVPAGRRRQGFDLLLLTLVTSLPAGVGSAAGPGIS